MKIENIDIEATIEKAQNLICEDKQLSAATRSIVEILILIISLLANRLNLNSTNSSKPPSSDPNRKKKRKKKTGKNAGGQKGHVGTTLKKIDDPDKVEIIQVDRSKLPSGRYRQAGFETRQVFDIVISRVVTEYRAQMLKDENGNRFVAPFPKNVTKAVQCQSIPHTLGVCYLQKRIFRLNHQPFFTPMAPVCRLRKHPFKTS